MLIIILDKFQFKITQKTSSILSTRGYIEANEEILIFYSKTQTSASAMTAEFTNLQLQ